MSGARARNVACAWLWVACAACGRAPGASEPADSAAAPSETTYSSEQLKDPEACQACHPRHYEEWAGSMHAYAAEDPVFRALNARGQRETDGNLGDFCVQCHAPMALRDGLTTDGLNLDEVPRSHRGVTCYFCHAVEDVEGEHNNPLKLADDGILRAGIEDPEPNAAHASGYSALLDGDMPESAKLCGSCHDIVSPAGVHAERTFTEWQDSLFGGEDPSAIETCAGCHMPGIDAPVAQLGDSEGPARRRHEHLWPGVDVALTDFPDVERQRAAIECELAAAVRAELCVLPGSEVLVSLETNVGHSWPSGATQDRRAWVELTAYRDEVAIYESGVIAAEEAVADIATHPTRGEDLWQLRSHIFDAQGQETHVLWEAAPSERYPEGVVNQLLPAPGAPFDINHTEVRSYPVPKSPDVVELAVHIRPLGLELLRELEQTGDLEPGLARAIPTFTPSGSVLRWTLAEDGPGCVTRHEPSPFACPDHYRK